MSLALCRVTIFATLSLTLSACTGVMRSQTFSSSQNSDVAAADKIDGAALYAANCALCHNPLATTLKPDRTGAQIAAARTAIPSMASNPTIMALSAAQMEAIAIALRTTVPGAVNPFACNTMAQPTPHRLQRLAKSEYVNTVRDLFSGVVTVAELQSEFDQIPDEINQDNPFDRGADSLNLGLIKAHDGVGKRIGALLTASVTKLNAIFSEACLSQATVTDTCLTTFINRFGAKAFRKPVKATEVAPLIAAYRIGVDRNESSTMLLRAILLSPNFLYHLEYDGTPVVANSPDLNLNAFELANRMAYLILNSMPDAQLTAAAANNSLMNAATYQSEMNRLLALPAARASFRRFFYLWFELNRIKTPAYTTAFKAGINTANINADALEESLLFTDYVVFENKKLSGLMTDPTAFVKSTTLAQVYGIAMPSAADGRVTLPGSQRAGILTRAARTLAGNDGTSPIQRGVSVRRSMLCDPIAAPDPNSLPPGSLNPPPDDPLLSTRQRFENKTSPAVCTTCHATFNPFGYALEGYDALGRYRATERILDSAGNLVAQHPVNAKTNITLATLNDTMVDGGLELSNAIGNSQKFKACFSKKWFQFAMRRTSTALDNCNLASTFDAVNDPNKSLLDAIKSSMNNAEFKMRRMKP